MTSLPTTTTAWRLQTRGSPATELKLDKDVPIPELKPGQALVAIEQAGINPVDWKIASVLPGIVQNLPRTMGSDFVGRVLSVKAPTASAPDDAFLPEVGQKVYGMVHAASFRGRQGSLCEHTVVPIEGLAPLPPNRLSSEQAAGLGVVGLTAVRMESFAKKGDRVLLLGASTGIGVLLAAMLKSPLVGVSHLVATASGQKIGELRERGHIDEFVDYRKEKNVEDVLKERYAAASPAAFDVILDCVGSSATQMRCAEFLKKGGTYFNTGASSIEADNLFWSVIAFLKNAIQTNILPVWLGGASGVIQGGPLLSRRQDWDRLNSFIEGGYLDPKTDSAFSYNEASKAYERLMTGRAFGKVVVKVKEDVE
ncbi:GroES-like protein [Microstroma glucosiphilum]|uniref:GroES-like protein n=1 Tax=Pseudomicrostroma glucosiphilum TaxID=1684307 RepID=A0A316UIQ9_9BASI|nr:GroES-like protein [Pseudomicrostroma glucosiphilum]PWN23833.1 GroES-like protein [Pseudomicrostroma glucosiphilum]